MQQNSHRFPHHLSHHSKEDNLDNFSHGAGLTKEVRFRDNVRPIHTGALDVSPLEVEQALLLHPDVERAKVFPIPDLKFGELVAAAVVMRAGSQTRRRDLKWFVFTHLAAHKVPQRIVMLDSIPDVGRLALAQALGFNAAPEAAAVFAIQPHGSGRRLYVVGASPDLRVRSEGPLFGIREPALAHLAPPHTIEHVAAECVHALRRFQPEGPYALGAVTGSRSVALEMARQMEQASRQVDFVALIEGGSISRPPLRHDRRHSWTGRTVRLDLAGVQ